MYNFNAFSEELFSFIKSELNSYHEIDVLSFFKENNDDIELKNKKEHNKILENKLQQFLIDYFNKIFSEIVFDVNGHEVFSKKTCLENLLIEKTSDIFYQLSSLSEKKLKKILLKNSSYVNFKCIKCGSYVDNIAFDLNELKVKIKVSLKDKMFSNKFSTTEPCPIASEEEYILKLKTPSKKLVFTNYFRGILDDSKYDSFSVDCYKGLVEHAKAYEADNIGYIYVGNTCPSVYLKKDKKEIKVGNFNFHEDYIIYCKKGKEEDFYKNFNVSKENLSYAVDMFKNFQYVNSVCTDLLAVCFMDYDQFISLLERKGLTEETYNEDVFIVDIFSNEIEVLTNNILYKDNENLKFSIKCI